MIGRLEFENRPLVREEGGSRFKGFAKFVDLATKFSDRPKVVDPHHVATPGQIASEIIPLPAGYRLMEIERRPDVVRTRP